VYANNPYDLEALKQNIREAIYNIHQYELQQVPEFCLQNFRQVSQRRADILDVLYDLE
jgi:hypothetical protein